VAGTGSSPSERGRESAPTFNQGTCCVRVTLGCIFLEKFEGQCHALILRQSAAADFVGGVGCGDRASGSHAGRTSRKMMPDGRSPASDVSCPVITALASDTVISRTTPSVFAHRTEIPHISAKSHASPPKIRLDPAAGFLSWRLISCSAINCTRKLSLLASSPILNKSLAPTIVLAIPRHRSANAFTSLARQWQDLLGRDGRWRWDRHHH